MVISAISEASRKIKAVTSSTKSEMAAAILRAKDAIGSKEQQSLETSTKSNDYAESNRHKRLQEKAPIADKNDRTTEFIRKIEGLDQPNTTQNSVSPEPIGRIPQESKDNISSLVHEATSHDEYVSSLNRIPKDILTIEGLGYTLHQAQQRRDELWTEVGVATTAEIYDATLDESFPIDYVMTVSDELLSLHPDTERYAATVEKAVEINVGIWQSEGRTHEVLDPYFEAVKTNNWEQVQAKLEEQYYLVPSLNPTIGAVQQHTYTLQNYGPDSAQFRTLVQQQETDILVTQPEQAAEAVNEAGTIFEKAEKLREVTDPAEVNPVTAALTLEQSQNDINEITEFLSGETHWGGITERLYGDLNAAIDSGSRSPIADPVIENTAEEIAKIEHPTSINTLSRGIIETVGNGDGVVLSLAVADSLNNNGRSETAELIIQNVTTGLENLETNVDEDVQEFVLKIEPFVSPNLSWQDYVGNAKADDALKAIIADTDNDKAFQEIADYLDNTVNPDGYKVVRAIAGLEKYKSELAGLNSSQELETVGDRFRQDDSALQFATSQPAGSLEMFRFFNEFNEQEKNLILSGGTLRNENREDVGARNSRNFIRGLMKLDRNGAPLFDAAAPDKPWGIGVNGFGVATYYISVGEAFGAEDRDIVDVAYGSVYTVGFVKEIIEVASGSYIWGGRPFNTSSSGVLRNLDGQATQIAGGVKDTPWDKFSTRFSIAGVALDSITMARFITQGEYIDAAGTSLSVAGGALPLVLKNTGIGASRLGLLGAGLSLAGTAVFFANNHRKNVLHNNRLEEPTRDFLTLADPDIDPGLAKHLGNHTGDGRGITPALDTLAKTLDVPKPEIYNWFKETYEQNPTLVPSLIENGIHKLEQDDSGNFIISRPQNDMLVIYPSIASDVQLADASQNLNSNEIIYEAYTIQGLIRMAEHNGHPFPNS